MLVTHVSNAAEVRITILVTVPQSTPKNAHIYVVGNHKQWGNWSTKGIELKKVSANQYQGSFLFKKGVLLQFKFTRGSWKTVEKDTDFRERSDRTHHVKRGQVLHCKVENWADMGKPKNTIKHTWTGIIKEHRNFIATKLKNKRTIWVYLPPSYPINKKKRYPVLYTHDGNNVFDAATAFLGVEWELDETAEKLIQQNKMREIIIVAIENNMHRQDEYTHIPTEDMGGGKADLYADFIIRDLKPFIDSTYRTLKHRQYTGIMGSSLGGLVSLYIAWKYSDVFSLAGVVSPSVWWADRHIVGYIKKNPKPPIKIWLDIGTLEGKYEDEDNSEENGKDSISYAVRDTRLLRDTLLSVGFRLHRDLEYLEVEGGKHNEAAWAKRVDKILLFFYGRKSKLGFLKKFLKF